MRQSILYTIEDGRSWIMLRINEQMFWLPEREIAKLFEVSTDNVGLYLKNILANDERKQEVVNQDSSAIAAEGKNHLTKPFKLDAMLAVGYRVQFTRGVQFSCWASTVLKEYLSNGCAMDDEQLKKRALPLVSRAWTISSLQKDSRCSPQRAASAMRRWSAARASCT